MKHPFRPAPPGLAAALDARERRAAAQAALLRATGLPLASLTLVSPGPEKAGPAFDALLDRAERRLLDALGRRGLAVAVREWRTGADGPWVLLAVGPSAPRAGGRAGGAAAGLGPALELKAACLEVEDAAPWGRLVDADVLVAGPSGEPLPLRREALGREPRPCLVCGGPALGCIASRAHPPAAASLAAGALRAAALHAPFEPREDRLAIRPDAAPVHGHAAASIGGSS